MRCDLAKRKDLRHKIRKCLEEGNYRDTRHALQRKQERQITREEVLQVLQNGHHEKRKDKYDWQYGAWNYAVRGKTIDRKDLRIIVSFDESNMLIITAIELRS
jgi:hypothetical protein